MRLLLVDTCGETGSFALTDGARVVAEETLPERAASSTLLPAIQRVLQAAGWSMDHVEGIAVVSGPGSFTGVRVGLAAAKGLCEARALPLVTLSRLEVLGSVAKLKDGFATLDAGRGELFVRRFSKAGHDADALWTREQLLAEAQGQRVIVTEAKLLEPLAALEPELLELSATAALPLALRGFDAGAHDAAIADANYIRSEQQIYGKDLNASAACTA